MTIPETLRDGRYRVGKLLGQGGMAIVATAHDEELGVDRAVKVLYATGNNRPTMRRRLKAEARAMARLHHPNILSIHDVGAEGDLDYVVMDLASGGSLQDLLERGPLRPAIAIQYIIQVLSALAAAHAEGVVHRDVKPHNILLDGSGRALLADFGIALLTGDDRRTKSGVAMGSLAFMPPEQRLDAAKVGTTADIYASGSTLFNLLTGDNPVDLFLATGRSPRWEKVPDALKPVLMKACTMTPEERWGSAGDMAYALLEVLRSDTDGFATADGPLEPAFPAPAEALSHHTHGTPLLTTNQTLLPTETSAATIHAVAELEKVAPQMGGTHHATRTSHEPTPSSIPAAFPGTTTWSATIANVPDAPVQTSPRRRAWPLLVAALLMVPATALLLWWALPEAAAPSHGSISVEPHTEPTSVEPVPVQPVPVQPAPVPVPVEPVSTPTTPEARPAARPTPETPPQPSPPRPRKPPAAPASALGGTWSGNMGASYVEVHLSGADATLRGTMTTFIAGKKSPQKVRGRFDPATKHLSLREVDATPPARFELSMKDDTLEGHVVKSSGGRAPLSLARP